MLKEHFPGNVLVTSISGKVPLLRQVRRALKRFSTPPALHGADADRNCLGRFFVDRFWTMPPTAGLDLAELIQYCRQHAIRVIFPTRDGELSYWARHAEILKQRDINVMVSPLDAVDACLDKLRFYERLQTVPSLNLIATTTDINRLETSRYVVKERYGAGSEFLALAVERAAAIKHAGKLKAPIFQPYVEGQEYSIDIYLDQKGTVHGAMARRRDLVCQGEATITTTDTHPKVLQAGVKVATSLNLKGHALVQVLLDDHESCHILECNCRFGGASTLSVTAGLDSFYWFLQESTGKALASYPFRPEPRRLQQIRHPADLIRPVDEKDAERY